jgi:hypothetical protein
LPLADKLGQDQRMVLRVRDLLALAAAELVQLQRDERRDREQDKRDETAAQPREATDPTWRIDGIRHRTLVPRVRFLQMRVEITIEVVKKRSAEAGLGAPPRQYAFPLRGKENSRPGGAVRRRRSKFSGSAVAVHIDVSLRFRGVVLCCNMGLSLPPIMRSLSARLLVLTMFFVMVSEILIFAPSIGRFRVGYLEDRVAAGRLAVLALEATPNNVVSQPLADQLLAHVGALGIVLHKNSNVTLMIDSEMPPSIDATVDLRDTDFFGAIKEAFVTLLGSRDRVLRVLGVSPRDANSLVEVLLYEEPMRREMWHFGIRVLELSLFISLMTAALVYLSLQWALVRPMQRLTAAIMAFRADPESVAQVIEPSTRRD